MSLVSLTSGLLWIYLVLHFVWIWNNVFLNETLPRGLILPRQREKCLELWIGLQCQGMVHLILGVSGPNGKVLTTVMKKIP